MKLLNKCIMILEVNIYSGKPLVSTSILKLKINYKKTKFKSSIWVLNFMIY